jgi:hypothetical protein
VTVTQPTPYRFKTLLERARQLAVQASQMEAGYLAALEKYDEKNLRAYDALKGIDLSAAQITLAASRVKEANDAVTAATAQRTKADTMVTTYAAAIDAPLNRYETNLLHEYEQMRDIRNDIADVDVAIGMMQAASSGASLFSAISSYGASVALGAGLSLASITKGIFEHSQNNLQSQMGTSTTPWIRRPVRSRSPCATWTSRSRSGISSPPLSPFGSPAAKRCPARW